MFLDMMTSKNLSNCNVKSSTRRTNRREIVVRFLALGADPSGLGQGKPCGWARKAIVRYEIG